VDVDGFVPRLGEGRRGRCRQQQHEQGRRHVPAAGEGGGPATRGHAGWWSTGPGFVLLICSGEPVILSWAPELKS
jgi:hypothetical protein